MILNQRSYGHFTRGKTARYRLRRVDNFVLMYDKPLIRRSDGLFAHAFFVDVGYGSEPFTTLESAARLCRQNPGLRVLGVEIDPDRVARARAHNADDNTCFRLGGFNLPLEAGETARVVRAFNVLRQYEESEVQPAWEMMGQSLLDGGLLIEGTSDPYGRVWVANVLRRVNGSLLYEGLLFSTNLRWGSVPDMFPPVLPKNYIHRMVAGEAIYGFMQAWTHAARETIAYSDWGKRQWFAASAHRLAQYGYRLELRRRFLRQGYLFWKENPAEYCTLLDTP
jgi:hypothetical protein